MWQQAVETMSLEHVGMEVADPPAADGGDEIGQVGGVRELGQALLRECP